MKVHMRFDDSNPRHTRLTLFVNGGNCGQLVLRTDEATDFHQIIAHGCAKGIDEFLSSGAVYAPTTAGKSP